MFRPIVPCVVVLAFGFGLAGCTEPPPEQGAAPASNATLDTGSRVTGQSGTPQSGGAAAVGTRPSGAITTTPTQ